MQRPGAPSDRGKLRRQLSRTRRRHLLLGLVWPLTAVVELGFVAYLMLPAQDDGVWLLVCALTAAGAGLGLLASAVLGAAAFGIMAVWLTAVQLHRGLPDSTVLVLALAAFAPLWLAALRWRLQEVSRLDALLQLPQVRACLDVSDWSALPSARALDERLSHHWRLHAGHEVPPVWAWRIRLCRINDSVDLFGRREIEQGVFALTQALRSAVRTGDCIGEDLRDHSAFYVLAFPNPRGLNRVPLDRRIRGHIAACALPGVVVDGATLPEDGRRLFEVQWHEETPA